MLSKRLITKMTKAMYAFGIVFLLTGLLLSAVSFPALAQEEPPDAPSGTGSLWTTNEGCANPAAQDDNAYERGEWVYVRGAGWDEGVNIYWTIDGQPGGASEDPGITVASGISIAATDPTNGAGYFCVTAYQVALDDGGTYNVSASYNATMKPASSDSYRVTGDTPAPLLTLVKTANPLTYSAAGDAISYSYLLTNDGNVPLDGPYTVDDDKATVVCPTTPDPLEVGGSITCTATYTITQADVDAGAVTNVATGHAAYAGSPVNSNTDIETVTATQTPALTLVKTAAPPTYDTVSDVVSYSYLLTNSGNVTLVAPFTVADDKTTVTCPATPTSLAPLASITCTASYTITQDDMDAGSVTNTATGRGYFGAQQITSDPDDETVTTTQLPALMLIKLADDASYDHVTQVLTYTYELVNIGNVSLDPPFSVIDDKTGTADCSPQPLVLPPGASTFCTASYIVTQVDMDAGSVVNIADGQGYFGGTPVPSNPDTAVVPAQVQGPALGLVKTVDPTTYSNVGDVLTYSYDLTNLGDVTLTGFTVTDDKATVDCSTAATTLAPTESTTCVASYTITQADVDAGFVTNVATAHGFDPDQNEVDSLPDTETATAAPNAVLTLDKTVDPTTYSNVGDVLNYSYLLTNGGNVTLTGFTVDDDKVTVDCSAAATTLLPGESTTCVASYTITQADIDAGSITNIAMAHGQDPAGAPVDSNDDTVTVTVQVQGPSLTLVKTATPQTYSLVDDVISYTYLVTNNGNVTIDEPFTIFDDKSTDESCPAAPASLAPGESITCTATYTIVQADLVAGSVTNIAYAQGFFDAAPVLSPTDDETVTADLLTPVVVITAEDSPTCADAEGEECITFTVNITGLTVGQIEFYADLLGYLIGDDPVVFTQDGEYQVTVCGLWPGIADPSVAVELALGAYAEWYVDGQLQEGLLEEASALVYYDPESMSDECFPLEDLAFLNPFCYRVDGAWTMAVQLSNPNDTPVDILWTLNGGAGQAVTVPALDKVWLANLGLGTQHTVAAVWGADGFTELKARMNLSDCETPPPPPPPGPPVPVTAVEAPVAEAGVLIPVTGVDLGTALGLGFFKSLMVYLGLGFLGMAFIIHSLRKKFN